jgi:heptosyltransferase III
MLNPEKILISRTDSIGDVILTLPVAGMLKEKFPEAKVIFMGRSYTEPIVSCCAHVDEFLNYDDLEKLPEKEAARHVMDTGADTFIHVFPKPKLARLAHLAGIKYRIGTTGRIYHWTTCNKLVRMSRKRSDLHEAQLNIKLLKPLGITSIPSTDSIWKYYGFTKIMEPTVKVISLIDSTRKNVILHPGSKGSAREWGLENFEKLITLLPERTYKVFISGTKEEGNRYTELLARYPHVIDLCGKLDLSEFISFISRANALVAASTGPLHIAAAAGITALGIYPPMRPIHPGRWAPLGPKAKYFVKDTACSDCKKNMDCHCMRSITAEMIAAQL